MARSASGLLQISSGYSEPVHEARRNLAHFRAALSEARRGDLPMAGEYYDGDQGLDLDEREWIEFFEDHVLSYQRALGRYTRFQYSCALAARDRLATRASTGLRRGPRRRSSSGPAPARRRGSRRCTGSRAGPDDDPGESEPPGDLAGRQLSTDRRSRPFVAVGRA